MNLRGKVAFLVALLVLVFAAGTSGAVEQAVMIDGTQWNQWSSQDKLVYIRGISNYVDFDAAAQRQTMERKNKKWFSISMGLANALKTKTLGQVVADVDDYYRTNPGKLNVSVVEVIFTHCGKLCPPQFGK